MVGKEPCSVQMEKNVMSWKALVWCKLSKIILILYFQIWKANLCCLIRIFFPLWLFLVQSLTPQFHTFTADQDWHQNVFRYASQYWCSHVCAGWGLVPYWGGRRLHSRLYRTNNWTARSRHGERSGQAHTDLPWGAQLIIPKPNLGY